MAKDYFPAENAVVGADGIPAAIVAVNNGEPLVLLVSEETMDKFNAVKKEYGFTHIELANELLVDALWAYSGQFNETTVSKMLSAVSRQTGSGL